MSYINTVQNHRWSLCPAGISGEDLGASPTQDVNGHKLLLQVSRSGKEVAIVFIPRGGSDRPEKYIRGIFPIIYAAARLVVLKEGRPVEIELRPPDLRRHAVTLCFPALSTG